MKKTKFIVLLFLTSYTFGQTCTINEIKLQPKAEVYNTKDYTIIYPVVVTSDKNLSSKINQHIRSELIDSEYINKPIIEALKAEINDRLTFMSYSVTFNENGILSLTISAEGCGAYCSAWYTYFNFDLNTGSPIAIGNIIKEESINSLKDKLYKDKRAALDKYKVEKKEELNNNDIDSSTYEWAIEEVDENCINTIHLDNLSLTSSYLEIVDDCEFPHAIQSQAPSYNLTYTYKQIADYLKEEYLNKFKVNK